MPPSAHSVILISLAAGLLLQLAAVRFVFARAIRADGDQLEQSGIPTRFVSPGFWALATLGGGMLTVITYWLIHHSSLTARRATEAEKGLAEIRNLR
ncbi:hypothetical protein [Planctomicrobium sp. SH664]|uniref:hypothetical protein n=1 Tax=Planctomicrobium sp. SH664 TaxID=3448125 RepID=UPI003F5B5AE0